MNSIPPYLLELLNSESVIACIGSGRSGKTSTAHYLTTFTDKPIYALGYPQSALVHLSEQWQSVHPDDVFKLKDCVLFVDDAALFASSRNFNSTWSKLWVQFQTIISHKNITIIFIVQSSNLLDIGTLRSQRMAILYKFSDSTNILYERDEFKKIALLSNQIISKMRLSNPNVHPKSWVYDLTLSQCWTHPLVDYWNDSLSTPFRDYILELKK
jgi:hypothetical protein